MKIVFCTYDGENVINGVNVWLLNLLPALQSQGFEIAVYYPIAYKDVIVKMGNEKFIKFTNRLIDRINIIFESQNSFVIPSGKNQEVLIAANGFYDPNIIWGGYMGTQRVKELLPFEYEPTYL